MVECQVRGCDRTDLQPIEAGGVVHALCTIHSLAMRAGDQWTYDPSLGEILLDTAALPELLDVIATLTRGNPSEVVEMHLGRDGIVERVVMFQISDDTKRALGLDWPTPRRPA